MLKASFEHCGRPKRGDGTSMKRKLSILIIILLIVLASPAVISSPAVNAAPYDSYEYYIKDFRVDVIVGSDRNYHVTEKITVFFYEESRGIFRDIQTASSVEWYRIENISVDGGPFTVTEHSNYVRVRIGDPDKYFTGEKTYTISYTRVHYDDGVPDFDYFYMDLIGDRWDVPVANFSATVVLPEGATINNYTITSGPTGNVSNFYADSEISGNVINVWMKIPLDPFMAVTLNVEMLQGAFPDAETYVKPLVIHSIVVNAKLDKNGVMTITEDYDVTVNRAVTVLHPAYGNTALSLIGPDGRLDPYSAFSSEFFARYAGKRIEFTYIYSISSEVTELRSEYRFLIQVFGSFDNIYVEKYTVRAESPFRITNADFMEGATYRSQDEYVLRLSDDGKQLFIEAYAKPNLKNTYVTFYSSGFSRALTATDFAIPLVAVAVAVFIFLFAFVIKPDKKLVTPIEFFPPWGMNPAEMGYIIDGKVSGRDVTSLIYFWASHGHLSIEITDNAKKFILHRIGELDDAHQTYEKNMFTKLFDIGDGNMVTDKDLVNVFYTTIDTTCSAIRQDYKGVRLLEKAKRRVWLVFAALLIGFVLMFYAFTILWPLNSADIEDTAIYAIIAFIVSSYLISVFHKNRYKNTPSNIARLIISIVSFVIMALFLYSAAAGTAIAIVSTIVTILSLAVAVFSTPFLRRKTDFCLSLLERIIGFKIFLTTAERTRLEMLLNQYPDYYYNILPYAQILGVSKIWTRKFDGLLYRPPTWCHGDSSYMAMRSAGLMSITKTLSNSMNTRPSSSGGGGGGSGGGGGFSGGGSSGGGGGGGGGRW